MPACNPHMIQATGCRLQPARTLASMQLTQLHIQVMQKTTMTTILTPALTSSLLLRVPRRRGG
jgi:hypothetical protein